MKRNVSKAMIKITNLAYNVAKLAANSSSWWGFYQPKEPPELKQANESKLKN